MRGIGRGCEGESPGVREGVDVRRCQREGVGMGIGRGCEGDREGV